MRSPLRLADPPVAPGFTGTRLTACNLCEAICGLELTLTDGRVTSIRGNPADPLSRGYICPKGVALADVYDDPDRLRRPIVRRSPDRLDHRDLMGGGRLGRGARPGRRPAGRDDRTSTARTRSASTSATPTRTRLASATHALPFVKSLRTHNRFSATTVDQAPHQLVVVAAVRSPAADPDPRPGPHVVPPRARRQPDGVERLADDRPGLPEAGAGDPGPRRSDRRARPAAHGDREDRRRAPLRPARQRRRGPARDAADPVRRGPRPPAGVRRRDRAAARARRALHARLAEEVSGLPADVVERLTRELAAADGGAAYGRVGVSTTGFGSLCHWAIDCLNLLAGHFDRPGGVLFPEPAVDVVGRRFVGTGHYDRYRSRVRGLPEYGGELPAAAMREEIETAGAGTDPGVRQPGRQPGALDAGRPRAWAGRSTPSTSWSRSTSTSTRRPGTPT